MEITNGKDMASTNLPQESPPANNPYKEPTPAELDSLALRALVDTVRMLQLFDDRFEEKEEPNPSEPPNTDIIGRLREMRVRLREMRVQNKRLDEWKDIDGLLVGCIRVRKRLRDDYEHSVDGKADEGAANQYFMDQLICARDELSEVKREQFCRDS
ncbi:hypothetical protein G7Y79_00005g017390 [Physcia stellaris]|nr:hypothetical protein G7Y79_00005g017390 [Physcia stellaris]